MEQPNLLYIKTLSKGDTSFEEKIIKLIKVEFPLEKEKYFDTLSNKKYLKAAEHVHKISHKISILGLKSCYELAGEHESNLREKNEDLKDSFEDILLAITNYMNTI